MTDETVRGEKGDGLGWIILNRPEKRNATTPTMRRKTCRGMDYWQAYEYMTAKMTALRASDPERGRDEGIRQVIDEKRYRPGLGAYTRE